MSRSSSPAGSDLSGHTAAGGFRATGSLGRCELKSSAGEITLDRAARAKLATAGDIRLERVTGDAELTTATGDVRAGEIGGSAVIKNSNGDTRIGEVGGDLRVKAANGDIDVERSLGSISAKTANGHIRVGSIQRGSLVAATATGHIDVGIADGVAAWLDLDTQLRPRQQRARRRRGPRFGRRAGRSTGEDRIRGHHGPARARTQRRPACGREGP